MLVDTDGSVSLDRSLLASALDTPNPETAFSVLNEFKNSLFAKANNASLDPVQYVNKIIVTYKRPHANFVSPYASSIYAGMMLDRYC